MPRIDPNDEDTSPREDASPGGEAGRATGGARRLFRLDVDLVMVDSTTAWFEIDDEDAADDDATPGLRQRGHSKEGRAQVVIAMAVTRDGLPVRSWVFPGNPPDVTTLTRIKADLAAMRLGRVLLVGDAGYHSKDNLVALARAGGRYVLATPITRIKEVSDEVLSRPGRYTDITPTLKAKAVVIGEGERRRRYVVCYNADEAERQRRRPARGPGRRAGAPAHGASEGGVPASRRFGPYLARDADGRPQIDRRRVARAERLDGR